MLAGRRQAHGLETLQQYRERLIALQSELEAEIQLGARETERVLVDGRMGRVSRGDAMQAQQLALEIERRRAERLSRVRSALVRMKQRLYGLCGKCRGPMDRARLDAFPDVVLCVRCASGRNRSSSSVEDLL